MLNLLLCNLPLVLKRAKEAAVLSLDKHRAHRARGFLQLHVSMSPSDVDVLDFTTEPLVDPVVPAVVEVVCV